MRTLLVLLLLLAACGKEAPSPPPGPAAVTPDAMAYFCNMAVAEHPGPRAQIWVAGKDRPLWFAQVRDAIAFTLLPETPKELRAIWVSDMAKSSSWGQPDAWVEADKAVYVIGSDAKGGMGLPETVPFSDRAAAERFVQAHGGQVVGLKDVPRDLVLDNPLLPR